MGDFLELPVAGRTYTVPQPPAKVGLALQASWTVTHARRAGKTPPPFAVDRMARYDNGESEMEQDALGPVWDELIAADVTVRDLRRAGLAAYVWICTGSETNALAVLTGGTGDEGGPKVSTTTDEADTTQQPASTSGTTSHQPKSND